MSCSIDHITVIAPTLESGSDWVFACLGARPHKGGEHQRMGTHNMLLRLGDAMYLEVIAVNPGAARPQRPRWFALDALPGNAEPRLACWVARTADIRKSLADASEYLGAPEPMARSGWEWLISIPEDGSLPFGGVAPMLIQWRPHHHPAQSMQEQGCRLLALTLQHPEPRRVERLLGTLAVDEPGVDLSVAAGPAPAVVGRIGTPHGVRWLGMAASNA